MIATLSDRLLAAVCPRGTAAAGPQCDPVAHCVGCGYEGSMSRHRWHQIWSNCREYWGPCLVNNSGCKVR